MVNVNAAKQGSIYGAISGVELEWVRPDLRASTAPCQSHDHCSLASRYDSCMYQHQLVYEL